MQAGPAIAATDGRPVVLAIKAGSARPGEVPATATGGSDAENPPPSSPYWPWPEGVKLIVASGMARVAVGAAGSALTAKGAVEAGQALVSNATSDGAPSHSDSGSKGSSGNELWRGTRPGRPLDKMGHAQKHLPDFQKLDPSLQAYDVARIVEYARQTGQSVPTENGGRLFTAIVQIGGRGVVVKVVESAAGIIKTGFPEVVP